MSSFPEIETTTGDDGGVSPSRLNNVSYSFMQEAFKGHLQQMSQGVPTNQLPRNVVQETWNRVSDNFQVIDYAPWLGGNEQVMIPKRIYSKIKKELPQATDTEIAEAYIEQLKLPGGANE